MPIGRPLSPMSVAGVNRRQDRRNPGPGNNNSAVKTAAVAATVGPGAAVAVHHRNK